MEGGTVAVRVFLNPCAPGTRTVDPSFENDIGCRINEISSIPGTGETENCAYVQDRTAQEIVLANGTRAWPIAVVSIQGIPPDAELLVYYGEDADRRDY